MCAELSPQSDWAQCSWYVDDIGVKSREKETLIDDLKETFDNVWVYKMMLNPTKCVFGVPTSELLGFLVSNRGIEANP